MAGRKRKAVGVVSANATAHTSSHPARSTRSSTRQSARQSSRATNVPQVYRDMLADADIRPTATSEERTIKRRRLNQRRDRSTQDTISSPKKAVRSNSTSSKEQTDEDDGEDERENEEENEDIDDIEFEDVALPVATVQTVYRDSDEEEEAEEPFEDVDFSAHTSIMETAQDDARDLELDLSAHTKPALTPGINRRKPLNKAEKDHRIEVHQTHLLCLLAHVARRNRWCNDPQVHDSLRPLLTPQMVARLNPGSRLTQFGQTLSLKEGLKLVNTMFNLKFRITERGTRKALWAETEEQLQDYCLPADSEAPLEKSDFREAAKSLSGSRDVGAQLYCALLRAAGVEARLVCSLQPLSFGSGGPYMPTTQKTKPKMTSNKADNQISEPSNSLEVSTDSPTSLPPRRRLGHPNAAAFRLPEIKPAPSRQAIPAPVRIRESPYPIYWVEVLDQAHQKWQPTDPLVTGTYWKPQKIEPPASDRKNCMAYVVSFEEDGTAKDVTLRYAKAYNAKTRRMRIESVLSNGERWWRKALRAYSRGYTRDLDQIEASEMAAAAAHEPMPRSIADFKDHPIFALERHLRRHEVLAPNASPSGTVSAGSKAPLEKVYRRKDVRVAWSREKWYRLGRAVLPNEIPVKFIIKPSQLHEDLFSDEPQQLAEGDTNGTPIYMIDQTELYKAPPVLNGKVPKNRYGNLDLYVPSMVPEGGVYIDDDFGAQAAFVSGVDYAPALTGFQFSGKKGTAVLRGVVVAAEHEEAVRAVIDGLKDLETEMEGEKKRRQALRMWKLLLMKLQIRRRVWADSDNIPDDMEASQLEIQADPVQDWPNRSNHSDEYPGGDLDLIDEECAGGGFEVDEEYMGGFTMD
ncbi:Rad4-domain-containing protein [Xylaria intraflava]|nr:Rad4-domain-containing protein [Xylaria intraflava]